MELTVIIRHTQSSEYLKDLVNRKVSRLSEHSEDITACRVSLDTDDGACRVKIGAGLRGRELNARGEGENMGKALDMAVARMIRQLTKVNALRKNHWAPSMTEVSAVEQPV